MVELRVGTAGWTVPRQVADEFEGPGSHLMRYARRFSCVEINSSFYKPHRQSTYARWAAAVPDDFRFSVKVPKEITHERRLGDIDAPLQRFLDDSSALGVKRGVLLVQLPPSFAYDATLIVSFLEKLRREFTGRIACEARHASWFDDSALRTMASFGVARVVADPALFGKPLQPFSAGDFQYWRLHGAPQTYYSSYDAPVLARLADRFRLETVPLWCIFDNTARGAAAPNALALQKLVALGS